MKLLRLKDGVHIGSSCDNDTEWVWDDMKVELLNAWPIFEHDKPCVTLALNGDVLWDKEGPLTLEEAWPYISLALLEHNILCESLPSPSVHLSLPDLMSP